MTDKSTPWVGSIKFGYCNLIGLDNLSSFSYSQPTYKPSYACINSNIYNKLSTVYVLNFKKKNFKSLFNLDTRHTKYFSIGSVWSKKIEYKKHMRRGEKGIKVLLNSTFHLQNNQARAVLTCLGPRPGLRRILSRFLKARYVQKLVFLHAGTKVFYGVGKISRIKKRIKRKVIKQV